MLSDHMRGHRSLIQSRPSQMLIHHLKSTVALMNTVVPDGPEGSGGHDKLISICTAVIPPTCEYRVSSWCSPPLIPFTDAAGCRASASACLLQTKACIVKVGPLYVWSCLEYESWSGDVTAYCDSSKGCGDGRACSNVAYESEHPPPLGGERGTEVEVDC